MTKTMPGNSVVALLVEGNLDAAARIKEMIAASKDSACQAGGILYRHVVSLREAGDYYPSGHRHCDVVLIEMGLLDGADSDASVQAARLAAAYPVIMLMGSGNTAPAVAALKRGCQDCLVKSELNPAALARAIYFAVERFKILRKTRENSMADIKKALSAIKRLNKLVPICMHCKQIRNDRGGWEQVEMFLKSNFHISFSHGICPVCAKTVYGLDHENRNESVLNSAMSCSYIPRSAVASV